MTGCLIAGGDHLQQLALLDGNVPGCSNMTLTAVPLAALEHVAPCQLPDFAATPWGGSRMFLCPSRVCALGGGWEALCECWCLPQGHFWQWDKALQIKCMHVVGACLCNFSKLPQKLLTLM